MYNFGGLYPLQRLTTVHIVGSCLPQDTDMQLPLMYGDREVTLSCPLTQPTLAPKTIEPLQDPTDSQQMFYPFPVGRPWRYPPYSHGRPDVTPVPPTVPPTTTTTTTLQDPDHQMFQQMYPMPMFDPYYFNSGGYPVAPQQSRYLMFHPYMYHYKRPLEATTKPSTNTATQFAGYPPLYPKFYGLQPLVPPGVKYPFMP